jgi:hypothetical protein
MIHLTTLPLIGVMISASSPSVDADDNKDSGGDLCAAVQNPISSLISLPFKFNEKNSCFAALAMTC